MQSGKKSACIFGIIIGIVIIIIGFCIMNPETYTIGARNAFGQPIQFGGDFYTEMYSLNVSVGSSVQRVYKEVCNAIGWLIIAIGLADISFFLYKMVGCDDVSAPVVRSVSYSPTQQTPPAQPSKPLNVPANSGADFDPVKAPAAEDGEIICPNCNTKQKSTRRVCWSCGQKFLGKGDPNAPFRCGKCGQDGPYEGPCPSCGSTIKFYN